MAVNLLQLKVKKNAERLSDYFPFLYQLYFVTSKSQYVFVRWAYDGIMLQIEYMGLQLHLASRESVFPDVNNVTEFLKRLRCYNFQKIELYKTPRSNEIWLQYHHRCFQAGHLSLLKYMNQSKHFSWSTRNRLDEMRCRLEHAVATSIAKHRKLLALRHKRRRGKQSRIDLSLAVNSKNKLLKQSDILETDCVHNKVNLDENRHKNVRQLSVAPHCPAMFTETSSRDDFIKELNESKVFSDFMQIYTKALNILLEK